MYRKKPAGARATRASESARLRPAHGALDRFLLLGREGDRRAAALELLHVDPRVVAALDRRDDEPGARGVEQRERGRLVAARVLVGVVADDRRVRDGAVDRRSTRARPAATSSTARWRSSIRPCSETAKSTRSLRPPPSSDRCASRTRRTLHPGPPGEPDARSRRRRTPASATISAVVAVTCTTPRLADLAEREDDRVARLVVVGSCSPGTGATSTWTVVFCANGTSPRSENVTVFVLARVDQVDRLRPHDRALGSSGSSASP